MAERFSDISDFHNVLFIGDTEQRRDITKWLRDEGYNCFVITPCQANYMDIIGIERVIRPEESEQFFKHIFDSMKDRYLSLHTSRYAKAKQIIDSVPNSEKIVVLIDDFEFLNDLMRETEYYLSSILAMGYASKICVVMLSDSMPQTQYTRTMLPFLPTRYLATDEKTYGNYEIISDEDLIKATKVALECDEISASILSRKLQMGFLRASSCVDKMRALGIIGERDGSRSKATVSSVEEAEKIIAQKNMRAITKAFDMLSVKLAADAYRKESGRTIYKFSLEKPVSAKKIMSYAEDLTIRLRTKGKVIITVPEGKTVEEFDVEVY